jgi:radical SAM superfamily enzyme YgiQ (UPF0313 family)
MTLTNNISKPNSFVHKNLLSMNDQESLRLIIDKAKLIFKKKCKRILIIHPPEITQADLQYETGKRGAYPCFPPYGIGVLAQALILNDFEVEILDLHYEILNSLKASDQESEFNFSVWKNLIRDKIETFSPDIIGFSMMFNLGHQNLVDEVEFVVSKFKDIPIIAGGVHLSLSAEKILEEINGINFILLHEAEETLTNFLQFINEGFANPNPILSLATLVQNKTVIVNNRTKSTDLIYSPEYLDLPIENYSNVGRIGAYTFLREENVIAGTVLSRRGCRAKCSFCSVRSFNGKGVKIRDYVEVVNEIASLKSKYGVSHIMWLDDDLFYDNETSIKMFQELASRNLNITWDASNGIIAAALNKDLLDACVNSGCVGFNIGIESGNPEILRSMQKPGTVDKFLEAATLLEFYPQIFTKGFLIIGYPGESLGQLTDTLNLALKMQLDWYPSQILTPMPGTPVHQQILNQEKVGGFAETMVKSETFGKGRTFSVGVLGELRKREKSERKVAKPFVNYFESKDMSYIPGRDQLNDIYVTLDYMINYKPIIDLEDEPKLRKKASMLKEIAVRMTVNNPLGTLFYSLCLSKLGEKQEANKQYDLAMSHLEESKFWQERFNVLKIDQIKIN